MKTVKLDELIHLVSYACENITLCHKKVPIGSSFIVRKSLWETTCPRCKRIIAGPKAYHSHRSN